MEKENMMPNSTADAGSLQDAFAKFRQKKIMEKKLLKDAQKIERTSEFKAELRQKFIDQCKKYIGVPYAERYKKPEDPIAPLYLDCCALVRKAVQDLQPEFGFAIGKWNQAYQMDTLPIRIPIEEAKPGDLIFYIGKYKSNRSKRQKHDCVHVEVFLGGETGEATIGSRFFKGQVSEFPSYKFTSTTWDCVSVHFCSLDTWLDGECKSHCPEHPWTIVEYNGKKSIFHDGTQQDDVDVGAGGDIDDEEEDQYNGNDATEDDHHQCYCCQHTTTECM